MISFSAGYSGIKLVQALSVFVNLVLLGKASPAVRPPPAVSPLFFGATLIALDKKGGEVRPIAIGFTLRCLVAKCASIHMKQPMSTLLAPQQ